MRLITVAASIAEGQLGLVTRQQLIAHGVPPTTIDDAVAHGRLVRIARGVYRLPGAPETPEVRMLAKALAAGRGALYSHRSSAWMWALLPEAPRKHELSVQYPGRPRGLGLIVHRSADLHLALPGQVRGVPVTGVGRTILDCASDPTIDLELLVDAAQRHHDISRTLLPATVVAHARRGRHGIRRLRQLVAEAEVPHSDFERMVARWLTDEGVTGWDMHHRIVVPGRGAVEIDFGWPAERVALELEGCDHRLRSKVHDDDTERQNWITLAGFTVLRTTYNRWIHDARQVLREIETALAAARSEPRAETTSPQWLQPAESGLWVSRA